MKVKEKKNRIHTYFFLECNLTYNVDIKVVACWYKGRPVIESRAMSSQGQVGGGIGWSKPCGLCGMYFVYWQSEQDLTNNWTSFLMSGHVKLCWRRLNVLMNPVWSPKGDLWNSSSKRGMNESPCSAKCAPCEVATHRWRWIQNDLKCSHKQPWTMWHTLE